MEGDKFVPVEQYTIELKHEYIDEKGDRHLMSDPLKATSIKQFGCGFPIDIVHELMDQLEFYVQSAFGNPFTYYAEVESFRRKLPRPKAMDTQPQREACKGCRNIDNGYRFPCKSCIRNMSLKDWWESENDNRESDRPS